MVAANKCTTQKNIKSVTVLELFEILLPLGGELALLPCVHVAKSRSRVLSLY